MRALVASMVVLGLWPIAEASRLRIPTPDAEGNCPAGFEARERTCGIVGPCTSQLYCRPVRKRPPSVQRPVLRPCPRLLRPVCAGGRTFANSCAAQNAGFKTLTQGKCREGGGDIAGLRNEVRALAAQVRALQSGVAALKKANQELASKIEALEAGGGGSGGKPEAQSGEEAPSKAAPSESVE